MALHNLTETAVQWVVSFKLQPQKDVPAFIDTKLGAGTRNRFLNLPWVAAKGKQPLLSRVSQTTEEEAAPLKQLAPQPFPRTCGSKFSGQRICLALTYSLEWQIQAGTEDSSSQS